MASAAQPNFTGRWKLETNENLYEYLKVLNGFKIHVIALLFCIQLYPVVSSQAYAQTNLNHTAKGHGGRLGQTQTHLSIGS